MPAPMSSCVSVECKLPGGQRGGEFLSSDPGMPFDILVLDDEGLWHGPAFLPQADPLPPAGTMAAVGQLLQTAQKAAPSKLTHVPYHGFLRLDDGSRTFTARLDRGRLVDVRAGGLESWATHDDPAAALSILAEAFSMGRTPPRGDVARFLAACGAATR